MKRPSRLELLPYRHHLKEAAEHFSVSERTIRRWLDAEGLYDPRKGWGPGKLESEEVCSIRQLYDSGECTQLEIAERFGITQAMVCRIINNQSHRIAIRLRGQADHHMAFRDSIPSDRN